jgi:hypothetical protein
MYLTDEHLRLNPTCPISDIDVGAMAHPVVIGDEPSVFELRALLVCRCQVDQKGALLSPLTRTPYDIADVQPVRYEGRDMERYYATVGILRRMAEAEGEEWVAGFEASGWPLLVPAAPPPPPQVVVVMDEDDNNSNHNETEEPPLNPRFERIRQQLDENHTRRAADEIFATLDQRNRQRGMLEYHLLHLEYGPQIAAADADPNNTNAFLLTAYYIELHRLGSDPDPQGGGGPGARRVYDECLLLLMGEAVAVPGGGGGGGGGGYHTHQLPLLNDFYTNHRAAFFDPYNAMVVQVVALLQYLSIDDEGGARHSPEHIGCSDAERALRERLIPSAYHILSIILKSHTGQVRNLLQPVPDVFDAERAELEDTLLLARFELGRRDHDRSLPPHLSVMKARLSLLQLAAGRRGVAPSAYLTAFDCALMPANFDALLLVHGPLHTNNTTIATTYRHRPGMLVADFDVNRRALFVALRALNALAVQHGLNPLMAGLPAPANSVFERFYRYKLRLLTCALRAYDEAV